VDKENVRKQEADGPVAKAETKAETKAEAKSEAKVEAKVEAPAAAASDAKAVATAPAPTAQAAPAAPAGDRRVTGVGVKPDVRFGQVFISKFINCLMARGKKSKAEKIFYSALDVLAKKYPSEQPLKIFETALNNVKPLVEVKSKRVGGATYQVPFEVNRKRQQSLAIRWVLEGARKRKGKSMEDKLALELVDAYNKTGAAWTMRENTHKMAEANKAFAHFAW
jgi:small subunit ribosomal protein S7